jgi:hypothetical protein
MTGRVRAAALYERLAGVVGTVELLLVPVGFIPGETVGKPGTACVTP